MDQSNVPIFSKQQLRMPTDLAEANRAYVRFWDRSVEDRPYLYADVILENEIYLRHVEFDRFGVAVRIIGPDRKTADYPDLFGRTVLNWCPIRSFSEGVVHDWASHPERVRFARQAGKEMRIRRLPMPLLLVSLIESGRWVNPDDDVIAQLIPFLHGPVDLLNIDQMEFESSGTMADLPDSSRFFNEVRGSNNSDVPELPWRDVSQSFFIAVNRIIGDDLGVALDFRGYDKHDPRVIASDWSGATCQWREVARSFSEFVDRIGI